MLYLDIGFSRVDVNVHPAKTEVKFTDEKKVFDTVYYAVLSALSGEKRTAQVELSPSTRKLAEPKADFYRSMSAAEFRANSFSVTPPQPAPKAPARQDSFRPSTQLKSPAPVYQTRMELPVRPVSAGSDPKPLEKPEVFPPAGSRIVEKPVQNVEKSPIPDHKIVGEALKTYIIVEQGESLILIDKHAAHERMIFDRLKSQDRQIMAQSLLSPVTVRPDGGDAELLEQNGELLTELGFEIEPFGQDDFIVRAVPADMDAGDVPAAIEEICEKLRRGKGPDPREARDEILHTVACKAAIKAGWDNDLKELERIVQAVLSGQVKYCPHGRPVSVTLTRKELDKQFKRIV